MKATIHNLNECSAQDVFDTIVEHLRAQGEQCLVPLVEYDGLSCKYRYEKENGHVLHCAAGCLIPNESYNPRFEGISWPVLIKKGWVSEKHSALIAQMQVVHDSTYVPLWESRFYSIALSHGLVYSPPAATQPDHTPPT